MNRKKAVIMMCGYPATGKTYISRKLEEGLKKKYKVLNLSTLDFRRELNLFDLKSNMQRDLVYDLLSNKVRNVVDEKGNEIIIVDGNFNKRSRREKLYSVSKNSRIYIVHCLVSDERIIEERMKERQGKTYLLENKAATMDLYYLIKDSSDNVMDDEIVKKGAASVIQFNSEKRHFENIMLNEDDEILTKEIISIIGKK